MKIGKKFNQFTYQEYKQTIPRHESYTDFNVLGLYSSLVENTKLSIEQQIEIRGFANQHFRKQYDFLQLKAPYVYFRLTTLGQTLTQADERQVWQDIKQYQEKYLVQKRIKHRNFGIYSKHSCGYEDCPINGLMLRQDSFMSENTMHFESDKPHYNAKETSKKRKKERKKAHQIIRKEWEDELTEDLPTSDEKI